MFEGYYLAIVLNSLRKKFINHLKNKELNTKALKVLNRSYDLSSGKNTSSSNCFDLSLSDLAEKFCSDDNGLGGQKSLS